MVTSIVGSKDFEILPWVKNLVEKKSERLVKISKGEIHLNWRFGVNREKFIVKVHISGSNYYKSFEASSKNFYKKFSFY